MFTGIVQATGEIVARDRRGDGIRMRVNARALDTADIVIGESVAVSGCCLTVVAREGDSLQFDVSADASADLGWIERFGNEIHRTQLDAARAVL